MTGLFIYFVTCLAIVLLALIVVRIFEERPGSTWSYGSEEYDYSNRARVVEDKQVNWDEEGRKIAAEFQRKKVKAFFCNIEAFLSDRKNDNSRVKAVDEIIGRRLPDPVRHHKAAIDLILTGPCEGGQKWEQVFGAWEEDVLEHSMALCYPNKSQCSACKAINYI